MSKTDATGALVEAATRYHAALEHSHRTRDDLAVAVRAACDAGMPEAEAARCAGVTRVTVRAWRGK